MPEEPPVATPFDDIRRLIAMMPGPDEAAVMAVRERDHALAKPPGGLGRLEGIVEWLAAWQGRPQPSVSRPLVCVFAANHGVARRQQTADPAEASRRMLESFAAGELPSTRSAPASISASRFSTSPWRCPPTTSSTDPP